MATRGLIGFRKYDMDKLMYNHWDSYPSSLGLNILNELRNYTNWEALPERVANLVPVPDEHSLGMFSGLMETKMRRAFPHVDYSGTPKNYYDLFRPLQGSLKPYLDGKLLFTPDASDFIQDSLGCEWAYITNMDSGKFEVWKGRQTKPDPTNRYGQEKDQTGYYPCAMVKEYNLKSLPDPDRFMSDYKNPNGYSGFGR